MYFIEKWYERIKIQFNSNKSKCTWHRCNVILTNFKLDSQHVYCYAKASAPPKPLISVTCMYVCMVCVSVWQKASWKCGFGLNVISDIYSFNVCTTFHGWLNISVILSWKSFHEWREHESTNLLIESSGGWEYLNWITFKEEIAINDKNFIRFSSSVGKKMELKWFNVIYRRRNNWRTVFYLFHIRMWSSLPHQNVCAIELP